MAYTETISYQYLYNAETFEIEEYKITKTYKDNVYIGESKHTNVFAPGADVSKQSRELQELTAAVWTPEVTAKYTTDHVAAQTKELEKQQAMKAELLAAMEEITLIEATLATRKARAAQLDAQAIAMEQVLQDTITRLMETKRAVLNAAVPS